MKSQQIMQYLKDREQATAFVHHTGYFRLLQITNPRADELQCEGQAYTFADDEGELRAILATGAQVDAIMKVGQCYQASFMIDLFHTTPQLLLTKVHPLPAEVKGDLSLIPRRWLPIPDDLKRLRSLFFSLRTSPYKAFWQAVFSDEAWLQEFMQIPASKNTHHAFPGGLFSHSIEIAEWTMSLMASMHHCHVYEKDAAVTLALLHDAGKVLIANSRKTGSALPYTARDHERVLELTLSSPLHTFNSHSEDAWGTFHRMMTDYARPKEHRNSPLADLVRILDRLSAQFNAFALNPTQTNSRRYWHKKADRLFWRVPSAQIHTIKERNV